MAKKSNQRAKVIIISIIVLIVLLVVLLFIFNRIKASKPKTMEQAQIEQAENLNKKIVADLSNLSEQQRMQYYCSSFFKLIDNNKYEEAYELLYDDYKENYFPTLNNFKVYLQDYFPSNFGLNYTNIERLGDIYVLMVSVKDIVSGSYGRNFNMYVVLKENALNDYDISFSRNSAVEVDEGVQENGN